LELYSLTTEKIPNNIDETHMLATHHGALKGKAVAAHIIFSLPHPSIPSCLPNPQINLFLHATLLLVVVLSPTTPN
jgi:hypothetical protein